MLEQGDRLTPEQKREIFTAFGLDLHNRVACMSTSRLVAKQVGVSGQISLGKEYAGRTVLIDSTEPGVWVIKAAQTIQTLNYGSISRKLLPSLSGLFWP